MRKSSMALDGSPMKLYTIWSTLYMYFVNFLSLPHQSGMRWRMTCRPRMMPSGFTTYAPVVGGTRHW